jgi:long-chain acyl-CoA synthetase
VGPDANLAGRIESAAGGGGLIVAGRRLAAAELHDRVARWRGGLTAAGVTLGDRVAIVAANSEEFVVAHLAAMGVGAISVPLNPLSPGPELARELLAVEPAVAIADQRGLSVLDEAIGRLAGAPSATPVNRLDPADLDQANPTAVVDVSGDAVACLIFTSGTAGPPKPAMLTHGNLTAGLQAMLSLPVPLVGQNHIVLGLIPMFHVFGLNVVLHLSLLIGATLVLDDYVDPATTVGLIAEHRITFVPGPPSFWQALLTAAEASQMSSVQVAVAGASKLSPQLKVAVSDQLGLDLSEGYGLTESSAVVASSIGANPPLGSVGRLLPGVEARIVDLDGNDCLVGDPGELLVRGPMVFPGYWEGEAGPIDSDGWLHTGDVAVVDDDGNLAIVDRVKDLIIVSGFNVYPVEVEQVVARHPDVAQVAVVGEPAESTGEMVVAHVVARPGATVDPEALAEHCRHNLARYKVPARFVAQDALPMGPTGKLQRNRLG